MPDGSALLRTAHGFQRYDDPVAIVTAERVGNVWSALLEVERQVATGLTAIGWVAYEAAPAFDAALSAHPPDDFPLLWFGLYREGTAFEPEATPAQATLDWQPALDGTTYGRDIDIIREYIAAGDTYQVNYSFPIAAHWTGSFVDRFLSWSAAQPTALSACIRAGRWGIASLSPELFFELDGERLCTRPMKGTRPRGRYPEEDKAIASELARSGKELAENVMITDLLRNDLGRVAQVGSVHVPGLFRVEKYPTVWQLTSTIEAQTMASVPDIFRALFPCGSVTGAPKVRTMDIIHELEPQPRGVYCGALGVWRPGRRAQFNVPIRTATVDFETARVVYPVGSGITWDSTADEEYAECLQKMRVLVSQPEPFELLETMRSDHGVVFLLEEHLNRLRRSAAYFDFPFDEEGVRRELLQASAQSDGSLRLRLLLMSNGLARVEVAPLSPMPVTLRVALHDQPVRSSDVFLFHKTTHRAIYNEALAAHPGFDEVLLFNERNELTEGCLGNVVVTLDGVDYTPPVACGLLAGCYRDVLLAEGRIVERVITRDELESAQRVRLINSVREWMEAKLDD